VNAILGTMFCTEVMNVFGSVSTRRTSSYLVMAQKPL